jgi:NADH-quinone oxidoreductase subunit F
VLGGRALKAWTPGGSSTPMLTASHVDTPLDYESLAAAGSMLGTAAIMVMDETDCVVDCAQRMVAFYAHESCGKCTPCREGSWWATRVLERLEGGYGRPEDVPLMHDMGKNTLFRAFCALADGTASVINSSLQHFADEYEAHVRLGRCPFQDEGADAPVVEVAS